jgi:hypothetical protein
MRLIDLKQEREREACHLRKGQKQRCQHSGGDTKRDNGDFQCPFTAMNVQHCIPNKGQEEDLSTDTHAGRIDQEFPFHAKNTLKKSHKQPESFNLQAICGPDKSVDRQTETCVCIKLA